MRLNFEETHKKWGLTAFLVILSSMLAFVVIFRFKSLADVFDVILTILTPFIYGLVFAYLLCPIYNFVTRNLLSLFERKMRNAKRALTLSKGIATVASVTFFLVVIVGIGWMVLPGLVDSAVHIADILPSSVNNLMDWLGGKITSFPLAKDTLEALVNQITDQIVDYVQTKMVPSYMELATKISTSVYGVLVVLKNIFVGIIICVYFLNSKELFAAQTKKLIYATVRRERARSILDAATYTNKTFGGFINGKLMDSLIIGILCFIVMTLFGWEYPLLISCIIGVTNVIPFFGPFIGAIPSALLILMVDPVQCLYFLCFILILQQFDGSILGPKILGDSTGLSSFWVMFAILVGGGLFGFVGMIIGIPVFAVIYAYFSRGVNRQLGKRGFSTDIKDYMIDNYRVKKEKRVKKKGSKEDDNKSITD